MHSGLNKRGVRNFFTYFTVPLIIVIVLVYVAWYYTFQLINRIYDYEKISLFVIANDVKEDIASDIYDYMNSGVTDDPVLEVDLYDYPKNESNLYQIYLSLGVYADLLIMPEYDLSDLAELVGDNFLGYDENLFNYSNVDKDFNSYKHFEYDGLYYGIKIFDPDDKEYNEYVGFTNWLDYEGEEDSYYLIINLFSENIHSYIETSVTDNAFIALGYLINRFGE
ncbi:MAG: hypothetical protein LUD22_01515 [Coprobacillus sp.]|nr:hypothetical protein [Coprobacillus sp.]